MDTLIKFTVFSILIFTCIYHWRFIINLPWLIYWIIKDNRTKDKSIFPYFGCWFFVGKQGSGKTMSLVETLELMRKKYPNVKIYSNFGYVHQEMPLERLTDMLNGSLYNGTDGAIFAIDEIQNEFSSASSKNFPESVLSLITQQRKNHILILTSSQVFTRVSKPLREQAFRVIECQTYFGRYTTCNHYDGIEYADMVDMSLDYRHEKMKPIEIHSFIQTDELRELYDSYAIIQKLNREGFAPKI